MDQRLDDKTLYLLDMDGTLYFDETPIDGALEFMKSLERRGCDFVYMTNNSSKSADDYIKKLERIGFPAGPEHMFTSGQATCQFLKGIKPGGRIYVVGTESLKNELRKNGFEVIENGTKAVDILLIGYDTELTYQKLKDACNYLCEGVPYYATNPDVVCPAPGGRYLPDCATMCYMLEKATGRTPMYIGKPRKEMALSAIAFKNSTPDKAVLVGDRLYTDIKCGLNADILTVLVLSGESTMEDIDKFDIHPHIIVDSVKDLIK